MRRKSSSNGAVERQEAERELAMLEERLRDSGHAWDDDRAP